MKKIFALLFAGIIGCTAFAQTGSMAIGTAAPNENYNIVDVLTNQPKRLDSYRTQKGLLVIFTCNTCPFVLKNVERTKQMLQFAKEKGIGVVLVNSNEAQRNDVDAPKEMVKFAKDHNYPNYLTDQDSKLADIFGASHTPEVFLFDGKTMTLVYKGAMDDNPGDPTSAKKLFLLDAMNNLASGQAISPNETKSVGCSIKRLK
jgi:thioredoxin-related protein